VKGGRQQQANVKARKAKARAAHEAKLNSYRKHLADRREVERAKYRLPMPGPALSMAAMERMIAGWETKSDRPRTFTLKSQGD